MFYFKCSSFADRGDNIKANRNVYAEMLDICIGSHYNVAYFLPINGILRFDVSVLLRVFTSTTSAIHL